MRSLRLLVLCMPLLTGCLYTHIQTPLDVDLNRSKLGDKIGKSQWQSVLWAVAWGDAGTQAAAKQGGLTVINHADLETFVLLGGLYASETTILYGE